MPKPKHVVWITTDHMRYDCVGAHGNPAMHTPTLDRLAREGIDFDRCYCQNPLCMPSRASFMTGYYPQQLAVTENGFCLQPGLVPTVADHFRAAGYQTAQIGKLHFQSHEDNDLDPRARHDYGFDVFWCDEEPGCYDGAYLRWLRSERPELETTFHLSRPNAPARAESDATGRVLDAPWEYSFSGWIAQQAERYLRAWGGRRRPQFMHLGFYAPHPPLNPTSEMFAPYEGIALPPLHRRDGEADGKPPAVAGPGRACADWPAERFERYRRHFYAMVTGVDLAVARVMAALESMGALEDTLIIFSSDHGDLCGDHGGVSKGTSFYEEIMRLPLTLWWPAGLGRAGRRVAGLVEMVDLLPTLIGLCGGAVPLAMPGRDYAPALLGGETPATRDDVFAYHGPGAMMLRNATHKYLRYEALPDASGPASAPVDGGPREVLYDLAAEPEEFTDRAGDPAYEETLRSLRDRALSRALRASAAPRTKTYRF